MPSDLPAEVYEYIMEMYVAGVDVRDAQAMTKALEGRPDLLLKFAAALRAVSESGGWDVPDELREALRQANKADSLSQSSPAHANLHEAVESWEALLKHPALGTAPETLRCDSISNASAAYLRRFQHLRRPEDLIRAIELARQAVGLSKADMHNRAGYLHNLARALFERSQDGGMADVEEGLNLIRQALELSKEDDDPNRPRAFNSTQALLLQRRYQLAGQPKDIEDAIRAWEEILQHMPLDHPERADRVNNMGTALLDRYARSGALEDLNVAIMTFRQAIDLSPDDSFRMMYRANLANALYLRHKRSRQPQDQEEARLLDQQNAMQAEAMGQSGPAYRLALAAGLLDRAQENESIEELEQSIHILREVRGAVEANSQSWIESTANLATALHYSYVLTGKPQELDEAIDLAQQARAGAPEDFIGLPDILNTLGNAVGARHDWTLNPGDLELGREAYRTACQKGLDGRTEITLMSGRNWGIWALHRRSWHEAVEAFSYSLEALQRLYMSQLMQAEKQSWLLSGILLHARAAYALARAGSLERAVVTLERGRARSLREAVARDRAKLEKVAETAPDLYQRYVKAAEVLGEAERRERTPGPLPEVGEELPPGVSEDALRHALLREQVEEARLSLAETVAAIRQLPGQAGFLVEPDFETVARAVEPAGALVYIFTLSQGSLALLLYRGSPAPGGEVKVEAVWADDFKQRELSTLLDRKIVEGLNTGYLAAQVLGNLGPSNALTRVTLERSLKRALSALGERLLAPVANRLSQLGVTRVSLVPVSHLGLFPLHAAHYTSVNGRQSCLMDEFEVSYAPSAQVLVSIASSEARPQQRLLAVGNPVREGLNPSPFTDLLAEDACRLSRPSSVLLREKATAAELQKALSSSAPAHLLLGCHGVFDPVHVMNSGIELADGRYNLSQLLNGPRLRETELVIICACQTAVSDFTLPDEVMGLPACFLQMGARAVVGSLWQVDALPAVIMLRQFYHLVAQGGSYLDAFRRATLWLRDLSRPDFLRQVAELKRLADPIVAYQLDSLVANHYRESQPFVSPLYWAAFTYSGLSNEEGGSYA